MTNPGAATTLHLAESLHRVGKLPRPLDFRGSGEEPARAGGKTPQSHCILDVSKLLATGVKMRSLEEACGGLPSIKCAAAGKRSDACRQGANRKCPRNGSVTAAGSTNSPNIP